MEQFGGLFLIEWERLKCKAPVIHLMCLHGYIKYIVSSCLLVITAVWFVCWLKWGVRGSNVRTNHNQDHEHVSSNESNYKIPI